MWWSSTWKLWIVLSSWRPKVIERIPHCIPYFIAHKMQYIWGFLHSKWFLITQKLVFIGRYFIVRLCLFSTDIPSWSYLYILFYLSEVSHSILSFNDIRLHIIYGCDCWIVWYARRTFYVIAIRSTLANNIDFCLDGRCQNVRRYRYK